MAAHGDAQAEGLNGKTAEDEGGALRRVSKKDDRGNSEEESGWHDK
jgi:hypothetical protein